ncbi:hypothetical protein E2562_020843 [Oryza meyeriana var. granulata]|uniref:Uncharacterized protein n=1 Tax=Oryza meyeriana var. granulata TaxID=110450 RepID=A0A6G1FAP5_9ORYZ|nr:hypothetical protein E2562_020843 [Oryza meyeriana var. granulata]
MKGMDGWKSQCRCQGKEGPAAKGWKSQSHRKNGSIKPKPFCCLARKNARWGVHAPDMQDDEDGLPNSPTGPAGRPMAGVGRRASRRIAMRKWCHEL